MAKVKVTAKIAAQEQLADGIYSMRIEVPQIASQAAAGQFVDLYSKDGSRLLPRPISLCGVDRENGTLRLVYRVAGAGTEEFSHLKAGDTIDVLGPLGNGFTLREGKKAFLIGGGIGIPPMLELAKELSFITGRENIQAVLGYRDSQMFLKEEFEQYGPVYVATEDGSFGAKGNVLDAIRENGLDAQVIYACGPTPMLKAVHGLPQLTGGQFSFEARMGCGFGACMGCSVPTGNGYKRVCKDGPILYKEEIVW